MCAVHRNPTGRAGDIWDMERTDWSRMESQLYTETTTGS